MSMVAVSCESQGAGCWGIVHNGRWFNIIFMNRDNVNDPLSPAHERLEHFERWEHIIIWNYFKWKSRFHYEQVSSTSMCFSALFKLFETIRREEWASEYRRMKGKTEEIKRKKKILINQMIVKSRYKNCSTFSSISVRRFTFERKFKIFQSLQSSRESGTPRCGSHWCCDLDLKPVSSLSLQC